MFDERGYLMRSLIIRLAVLALILSIFGGFAPNALLDDFGDGMVAP